MFRASHAHRQENRLYKTVWGVSLDVLAAVVWSQDTSCAVLCVFILRYRTIYVDHMYALTKENYLATEFWVWFVIQGITCHSQI